MRSALVTSMLGLVLAGLMSSPSYAIEAVRGKEYQLSDRHGPWMIMVASFRDVPEDRREEGLSASEAAAELVYELRKQGIPAYTYGQGAVVGKVETVDRLGREDDRIYAAQRDMISVIAGNYPSIDDKTAQATLKWVKAYIPEFMKSESSGALFRQTPGRQGPLSGAFLTINPVLKPGDVVRKKLDPDVVRLNNETRYPLMGCKKPYSVQVATFMGRQTTPIAGSRYQGKEEEFDRDLANANSYSLNRAGEDAEQLAAQLRSKNIEAYTHHDRYQSIVTVGGFDSPQDPMISQIIKEFGPKYLPDPNNEKQESLQPQSLVERNPANPAMPLVWLFDYQPKVVPVPRKK